MIRRIGATTEKVELDLTIHSVRVHLDVPCALKVVVKRGKHKSETQELRYHMRTGVVFFDHEIRLPVTLYKRGRSYQEKQMTLRLVRVLGNHQFKDGKCKINLNEIASTSTALFREDIPLKHSLDKHALVCISLNIAKQSGSEVGSPGKSVSTPPGSKYGRGLEGNRSELKVNTVHDETDSRETGQTPVTAGANSAYYSPESRGIAWSPVSAQPHAINSLYSSPGYPQTRKSDREYVGDASPLSAPIKPGSFAPIPKQSVDSHFEESEKPFKSSLLKLIKVEESLEDETKAASAGTSISEEEAPNPAAEFIDTLSDGEEEAKAMQERKRAFRLDLSKGSRPGQLVYSGESGRNIELPVTTMKSVPPNKKSKEKLLETEEERAGMAVTRERGSACSGCILQ